MRSKIDRVLNLILILIFVGLVLEGIYIYSNFPKSVEPAGTRENKSVIEELATPERLPAQPEQLPKKKTPEETNFSESINLDIPFVVQAPLGDWSPPFDHTCEEAAILMVHYFFQKEKAIDPVKVSKELEDLVDFQIKKYGFYQDSSAAQTAQLIKDYYGYQAEVYYDISLEDIKKALVKGNPVIVPAAGRLLGNPYFTPPGPVNHMLLIKGYNQDEFITNDPGTKRGADFTYSYSVLEKAIRDYGENVKERKAMIVIYPPDN